MANSGTAIKPCDCKHKEQDRIYGKGLRLHNFCNRPATKDPMKGLRCTVCSKVKAL